MNSTSERSDGVAAVIVLAAGGGTRMKSATSKLLHRVAGRPMLSWAVAAARGLDPENLVVVVGHKRDQVEAHLHEDAPDVRTAVQAEQKGTGHAVACGLDGLGELDGEVVVTYGDVPMLTGDTLRDLVAAHREQGNLVTVLTADLPDPTGYGRILRDGEKVTGIVEHKDASEDQLAITEINSGIYVFDSAALSQGVVQLSNDNAQGEYYLTDVVTMAAAGTVSAPGHRGVGAWRTDDLWQTEGVNDRVQLARMNREVNRRIVEKWMRAGVTIVDPDTTWIQPDVDIEQDVQIEPGTFLNGATTIRSNSIVGPDCTITDSEIGHDVVITRSEVTLTDIADGARVGPWANLRPGTMLGSQTTVGAFTETKNAQTGRGTAIKRLSYAGDVQLGDEVTVSAGTVFANNDGVAKQTSTVGDGVFLSSSTTVVAPVKIESGSFIPAGSVIDAESASAQDPDDTSDASSDNPTSEADL